MLEKKKYLKKILKIEKQFILSMSGLKLVVNKKKRKKKKKKRKKETRI